MKNQFKYHLLISRFNNISNSFSDASFENNQGDSENFTLLSQPHQSKYIIYFVYLS